MGDGRGVGAADGTVRAALLHLASDGRVVCTVAAACCGVLRELRPVGLDHGTLDRPIADPLACRWCAPARQCFAMCATVATQASAHIGRAACRAGTHTHALAATCRAVDYVDYPRWYTLAL